MRILRTFLLASGVITLGCNSNLRVKTSESLSALVCSAQDGGQSCETSSIGATFTSLVKTDAASDGYINNSEKNGMTPLWMLTASGQTTTSYTLPLDNTSAVTCDGGKTYDQANIPAAADMASGDVPYVICVRLVDAASNITYGKSEVVTRDVVAPSVNAGADLNKNATSTLDATTSDGATYQWSQQSGSGTVTFGSATAEDTTVSASNEGTYVLRLTVNDAAGNSAFDETSLVWDTTAPAVNAGADMCGHQNIVQSADATVGGATSYSWVQSAGPGSCSFATPSTEDTTVTCDTVGSVTLTLTATDDAGNAASDSLTFTVHPGGTSGTANLCFGLRTEDFAAGGDGAGSVVVQPDGKIVVAGGTHNGTDNDAAFVRYNPDGTLDTGFGTAGKVIVSRVGNEGIASLALHSDGSLVAVGFSGSSMLVIKLTPSGALDTTFSSDGIAALSGAGPIYGEAVAVQSDGKIVAGAQWHNGINWDFGIVRFTTAGAFDTTFDGDGYRLINLSNFDGVYDLAVQSDGKIVAAGYYYNGSNYDFAIVRLTTTGALDPGFAGGSARGVSFGTGSDTPHGLALQADGKIVIAGDYQNGASRDLAIARLNTDGSLDTSFDGDGKAVIPIASTAEARQRVAIQSDGKIVIAGSASNSTDQDFLLARLNSDGSVDTSFSGDGVALYDFGGTDTGQDLAFDANGDIVIVGSTSSVGGGAMGWLKAFK